VGHALPGTDAGGWQKSDNELREALTVHIGGTSIGVGGRGVMLLI